MSRITGPAADLLEKGRERFNTLFAAARKAGTPIAPTAFLEHIATHVVPIVNAVAVNIPERAGFVLDTLYGVSIELFIGSLLGPQSKSPSVAKMWEMLLPAIPKLLVRDPQKIAAALSNAAYNIDRAAGASPEAWLGDLVRIAPLCQSVTDLLEAGKIAAWRAGMAQYRVGALNAAKTLAAPLASAALEISPELFAGSIEPILAQMQSDPWASPEAVQSAGKKVMCVVGRAGAFRGFGGEFISPPRVWLSGGGLYIADSESTWQIIADIYGSVLVRHEHQPAPQASGAGVKVTANGTVEWDGQRLVFPELLGVTSFACDGTTLAVTLTSSHHVFLIAKTSTPRGRGSVDAA